MNRLRIGFVHQIFRLMARGGISRNFADLIAGLPRWGDPMETTLAAVLPFRLHGNAHLRSPDLVRLPFPLFPLLGRLGLDAASLPTDTRGLDLLHATYYLGLPPAALPCPLISTLHDMTPEKLPELAPLGRGAHRVHKRAWLEASTAIVCVSASSAADLIERIPTLGERVRVIHLGSPFFHLTPQPCAGVPRRPFHLHVGRRGGYKNTEMLYGVHAGLPHDLVLAGGGPLDRRERQQLRQLGLENRVHALNPNDAQLAWLYRHCRALLVPSLAEGFSLPLIEALACDAPVLASHLPVHREIGHGYVQFLDPLDPASWRAALAGMAPPPRPSQQLSARARSERSRYFCVERMVTEHRGLYRELL
jgi:glycosyltransferase involved in cell wall biosynthesis